MQPRASLVAIGAKRLETRSKPTEHRGLIAIHASKGYSPENREIARTEIFERALFAGGVSHPELYCGQIVAVAELVDCVRVDELRDSPLLTNAERAFGNFSDGRYAYVLQDARPLKKPIPFKGQLGLWEVPSCVVIAMARQLWSAA